MIQDDDIEIELIPEDKNKKGFWEAGTYAVAMSIDGGPIVTSKPIELGNVEIKKRKVAASEFKFEGTEREYDGGWMCYQKMDMSDGLDLQYYKEEFRDKEGKVLDSSLTEEGDDGERYPFNAGTYQIWVPYKGDPNCEDMEMQYSPCAHFLYVNCY